MGPTMVKLVCGWCSKAFEKAVGEVNRQRRTGRERFFCSLSCSAQHHNERRKNKPITKTCPHCGKDFESDTGAKAATYCSRSCASAGSMTPERRAAMRRGGQQTGGTIEKMAAAMREREAWRYVHVKDALDALGVRYQFEYPIEDVGIFDLALPGLMVLVEFDGPDHDSEYQRERDEEKDRAAKQLGWRVERVPCEPGEVIRFVEVADLVHAGIV